MGLMEYADASDFNGPRSVKDTDTAKALCEMVEKAERLFFVIDHPRYKGVYAEVDPYIDMAVTPGIYLKAYGFIMLTDGKLVVLQKKTAHWHQHHTKTNVIASASKRDQTAITDLFQARVSLLMGSTPPRNPLSKDIEE